MSSFVAVFVFVTASFGISSFASLISEQHQLMNLVEYEKDVSKSFPTRRGWEGGEGLPPEKFGWVCGLVP